VSAQPQSPAPAPEARLRRATTDDWAALAAFYAASHAERSRLHDEALWRWAFASRPGPPTFFVLESATGIVGGIGYVPVELRVDGDHLPGALPVNYFVDDRYRGLPALRLLRAVQGECARLVGAYVSPSALRLLVKSGFTDLSGALRAYHRGVRSGYGPRRAIVQLARRIADAVLGLADRLRTRELRHVARTALDADLDDRFASGPGAVGLRKTAEYLRWRYERSPALQPTFVHRYEQGALTGIAVLQFDRGGDRALLLDLLVRDAAPATLTGLVLAAVREARVRGASTLVTQALSGAVDAALRRCLFGTLPGDLGLAVQVRDAAERASLGDPSRWHFMLGDCDAY
jgi:hypothetical protein